MHRLPSLSLATLIVAATVAVPTRAQRVVPPAATKAEANASSALPFLYDKTRVQQLFDGDAIAKTAAVIRDLSYRRDGDSPASFAGRKIGDLRLSLAYSGKAPATMSKTFAANLVAGSETLLFSGSYDLPANPVPIVKPAPFNVRFTLSRPFVYQRSKGNLLVEIVVPGNAQSKHSYLVDAHQGGVQGGAWTFGQAGQLAGGAAYSVGAQSTGLVPGGTAKVFAAGLPSALPTILVAGISDRAVGGIQLPVDFGPLGAPGNALRVSPDFLIPVQLAAMPRGGFGAELVFQLPRRQSLVFDTFFGQWLFVDPKSNTLGLVTSPGIAVSIGGTKTPASQVLGQSDSTSKTGWFDVRGSGGPVVRFGGTFN